jgi:hypothetical protein
VDEDAADLGAVGHAVQLLAELRRALKVLPMCGERRSCPVLKNIRRIIGVLEAEILHYDAKCKAAEPDKVA